MNKERNGTVLASGSALPARRDYKDTIFRRLFQDRENLLSLYNMPLRDLFYVSRTYQGLVKDETLYSSKRDNV